MDRSSSYPSSSCENLIADIAATFAPELAEVERVLREITQSDSQTVREVGEYVSLSSGKKLRPLMCLLSFRALSSDPPGVRPAPVEVAAAVEAIHVATLIHDDVIDKAPTRRGRPSVNARWGDDVAILMADYTYASAFELVINHLDARSLAMVCNVTRRMCEGEMFQIEKRGKWLTPEEYLKIITLKTAGLFSAAAGLGALAAGADGDHVGAMAEFGLDFGLAFQITDDALDYIADDDQWGKSVGIDLAEGKQTLPLILALREADDRQRTHIKAAIHNGGDLAAAVSLLRETDAIERSLEMARSHAQRCSDRLAGLAIVDGPVGEHLRALPEYVVQRRY